MSGLGKKKIMKAKDKFIQYQAEIGFFKGLKKEILKILSEFDEFRKKYSFDFDFWSIMEEQRFKEKFIKVAKKLCSEYNREYSKVNKLLNLDISGGLHYISTPSKKENVEEWYSTLRSILPECEKAIKGLNAKILEFKCPIINLNNLKERLLNLLFPKKKWFTMNNPLMWLIFSLILFFIIEILK